MSAIRVRRDLFVRGSARLAAIACLLTPAIGCKSGSWVSKPSWMTFGQKAEDAGRLSSAPAFAGDPQKPSATAKPYPTTSTPEGYTLPDPTAQASTAPGAAPAAVTYGVTPPPEATAVATSSLASRSSSPVAPQVGPYASSAAALPPEVSASAASAAPPSSAWTGATAAAPPPAAAPAIAPVAAPVAAAAPAAWPGTPSPASSAEPPQRFADARAASPAWTPATADPPSADGRYGSSGTSRFATGGPAAASASVLPMAEPATPPFAVQPAATAPPATLQPASPATPASSAPLRRPDPLYRPGNTSSYRPTRSSLAGPSSSGVQPASFEVSQSGSN
jgi:hypothetical protein